MADLLAPYDPTLEQKRQAAEQAAGTAGQYQSAMATLPDRLKQAIMEKLNYNQDILSQQNQAQANYFAAPSAARAKYQDITNPFDREALVAQSTANAYAPYATLSQVLSNRQGSVADAINAGTGAFQAVSGLAQNSASLARQSYADALANAQWQYEMTHAKPTAGSTDLTGLADILKLFQRNTGNTQQEVKPTEPEPMYSPRQGEGALSSGGQWVYHQGEWMINVDAAGGGNNDPLGLGI